MKTVRTLRIGDDWNAISIIAMAQQNPLKAVAELVENSIDAGAKKILITRGREGGEAFLSINDDGSGIQVRDDGVPDFDYVATHICDSLKRRQKQQQPDRSVQGEFGIGLLSFWTLGEELTLASAGTDGRNYQMRMGRDSPHYAVSKRRDLVAIGGTDLKIKPLLPGLGRFHGDKIRWYLGAELRDRIRASGVEIVVQDRQARAEFRVEPREFDGQPVRDMGPLATPFGEVQLELYLADDSASGVGLYRSGTRVLASLDEIDRFAGTVWVSGAVEGTIDAPFLRLTPGTRSGIIRDVHFEALMHVLRPVAAKLEARLEERRRAQEEQTSRRLLRSIQRAFREALMGLPNDEYDLFDVERVRGTTRGTSSAAANVDAPSNHESNEPGARPNKPQKDFFNFAGPLHSVRIVPQSAAIRVGDVKSLRAICRDRSRRRVADNVQLAWRVVEGAGTLEPTRGETVDFTAPPTPGRVRISVIAEQHDIRSEAEAVFTIADELIESAPSTSIGQGLPNYTFEPAPAALWRSRFDDAANVIVVNNGHRDFVYASRSAAAQLRYIARLYAKEMVRRTFPGAPADELLERMVELTLHVEDHLRLS